MSDLYFDLIRGEVTRLRDGLVMRVDNTPTLVTGKDGEVDFADTDMDALIALTKDGFPPKLRAKWVAKFPAGHPVRMLLG